MLRALAIAGAAVVGGVLLVRGARPSNEKGLLRELALLKGGMGREFRVCMLDAAAKDRRNQALATQLGLFAGAAAGALTANPGLGLKASRIVAGATAAITATAPGCEKARAHLEKELARHDELSALLGIPLDATYEDIMARINALGGFEDAPEKKDYEKCVAGMGPRVTTPTRDTIAACKRARNYSPGVERLATDKGINLSDYCDDGTRFSSRTKCGKAAAPPASSSSGTAVIVATGIIPTSRPVPFNAPPPPSPAPLPETAVPRTPVAPAAASALPVAVLRPTALPVATTKRVTATPILSTTTRAITR